MYTTVYMNPSAWVALGWPNTELSGEKTFCDHDLARNQLPPGRAEKVMFRNMIFNPIYSMIWSSRKIPRETSH